MIRVLLFEDNKNYREALEDAFAFSDEVCLTESFPDANKAVRQVQDFKPDVVLMDIELPGISGLDALAQINQLELGTKVMIQTQFEDDHRIFVALCRGAWGYALKQDSFEKMEEAIKQVHLGGGYFSPSVAGKVVKFFRNKALNNDPDYVALTEREHEVLTFLKQGLKYQEIADQIFLSYEGVHSHIKNIYKKLHVNSRTQAILKAMESKLI